MNHKSMLLAAAPLCFTLQSQAMAQSSNTGQAVPGTAANTGVEEIVVTAQRREEKLQDVPIAVSAITAASLQASGISGTNDLSFAVPGLELGRQNGAISPFIRGIGNRSTAPGEESAVPLYIDGVYMPTLSAGLMSLDNVERVEVLKGPQGTLFGRNATAGVIQIITRDPSDTPRADIKFGYGNYDTYEASLYASTGLAPGVRADIAAYSSRQNDGWGTNLTTGNEVFKGYEHSVRSKWVFDLGDRTELKIAADYGKVRPNTPPAYHPLSGKILTTGAPSFVPSTGYSGFYDVAENRDVTVTTRQWGANAQLHHNFGKIDLLSITSYRDVKTRWIFDQDGGPINAVSANTVEPSRTWTQELQLLSNNDSNFQWIVGTYYFNNTSKYAPIELFGTNPPFNSFTITRFTTMDAESFAGFAQGTYSWTPRRTG